MAWEEENSEDLRRRQKEKEEREAERRNREPISYCTLIVQYPKSAFAITLGGHILLTLLNILLLVAGYDILPVEFEAFPVELKGHVVAQREYAWNLRDNDPEKIHRFTLDDIGPWWDRGNSMDDVTLFYTLGDEQGNVFQRDVLLHMQEVETKLFSLENYQKVFCQLNAVQGNCTKPTSIVRYFDGTYKAISDIFYDPDFRNIPAVLHEAYTQPDTSEDFKYFLPKGYIITPKEASGNLTRSHLPIGWPLETGTEKENQRRVEEFLNNEMVPEIEKQRKGLDGDLELNYYSWNIFASGAMGQAIGDMLLAVASVVFIFGFVWFQTGSLWITGWAIFSIITSFFITNLFYRIVLDYRYIGYFHIIAIFIILGIGADDIFVFFNIWKASSFEEYPSLQHRVSACYRTAGGTMFFTSFTTMMAFAAGGVCPLLPIGSFGIFTAVLIAVNYISVIIFFPTVILTHHLYFDTPCCRKQPVCCAEMNNDVAAMSVKYSQKQKKGMLVRFFRDHFFFFVTHKVIRWIIVVFFLGVIGFLLWSATRLEASAEETKIYRKETNLGKAMSLAGTGFIPSGDNFVVVQLVWGMGPRDFRSCHKTDYNCNGEQVWREEFDMNTPPAQLALLEFCEELKHGLSQKQVEELMIRNNSLTGELEVDCFLQDMDLYLQREQAEMNGSIDLSLPLTQKNMDAFMLSYPDIYEPEKLPLAFYRYLEIGVSYWLSNGYSLMSSADYITYNNLIGEARDGDNTQPVKTRVANSSLAYYGTKLRYAAIRVNLSLSMQELNYIRGLPIMDKWEHFFSGKVATMPLALRHGFQVTDYIWHWLKIQQALSYNAILGVVVGLCVALPVLILATMNLITGFLATLIIGCVTAAAMGILPLADWKLDMMVSMNLCLLVGLSVDYVVHLAEGYHLSLHRDRLGRVRDMLEHLGVSVLSGALTTLGAAIPMVFAKIQFFLQFGSFLLSVIGFSLLFSLVFFSAVMGIIGPRDEVGSLYPLCRYIARKVRALVGVETRCGKCGSNASKPDMDKPVANGDLRMVSDNTVHGSDIQCETSRNKRNTDDVPSDDKHINAMDQTSKF